MKSISGAKAKFLMFNKKSPRAAGWVNFKFEI